MLLDNYFPLLFIFRLFIFLSITIISKILSTNNICHLRSEGILLVKEQHAITDNRAKSISSGSQRTSFYCFITWWFWLNEEIKDLLYICWDNRPLFFQLFLSFSKETQLFSTHFSRWPWVTDPDPGSCTFCQMILRSYQFHKAEHPLSFIWLPSVFEYLTWQKCIISFGVDCKIITMPQHMFCYCPVIHYFSSAEESFSMKRQNIYGPLLLILLNYLYTVVLNK